MGWAPNAIFVEARAGHAAKDAQQISSVVETMFPK
jgi:hypothetical protein